MSDRGDGVDARYHIVVAAPNAPEGSVAEVYFKSGGSESTLGQMTPVPGTTDTWEYHWDISDSIATGPAALKARLFYGGVELSSDEVAIDVQHKDGAPCPSPNVTGCTQSLAAQTAELTWPPQGGRLGFYKQRGGKWNAALDGLGSAGASGAFKLRYSVTPLGLDPVFKECGSATAAQRQPDLIRPFQINCELKDADTPSMVTAVGVVATVSANESSDTHRVQGYAIDPSTTKVTLRPFISGTGSGAWPTGRRRVAKTGCMDYAVVVTDDQGRPVQGANVDVRIAGPGDSVAFGTQVSNAKTPDGATEENVSNCAALGAGTTKQGKVIVPEGPDIKHIESVQGTGLSGSAPAGEWRFKVFATDPGTTSISAWVDDESTADELTDRVPDNETLDADEPVVTDGAQWLESDLKLFFQAKNDTATIRGCNIYTIDARGGQSIGAGLNIDVHVQGPKDVEFCAVDFDHAESTPDKGEHPPNNLGDSHPGGQGGCPSGLACEHREGVTDEQGRFRFGLVSRIVGTSTINAWIDGEAGTDNDVRDGVDVREDSTTSWINGPADARVRLVSPSGFPGATTGFSRSPFYVVARVDAPYIVPGVEILLGSGSPATFSSLGEARRIGMTDTWVYELDFDSPGGDQSEPDPSPSPSPSSSGGLDLPDPPDIGAGLDDDDATLSALADGSYTIRARIIGTQQVADNAFVVNRRLDPAAGDTSAPPEWAQLSYPENGTILVGTGNTIDVNGLASAGAEGIEVYYSKSLARDATTWVSASCGYIDLAGQPATGTSTTPQPFSGVCRLAAGDRLSQVSAISVTPFDCTIGGCEANPSPSPSPSPGPGMERRGSVEGGDARRVFGCATNPCLLLGPTGGRIDAGGCYRFVATVAGDGGAPVVNANVDVHIDGPGDNPTLCDVADGSPMRPASGGDHDASRHTDVYGPYIHHFQSETDEAGRVIFGVMSEQSSYHSIYSTVEWATTDVAVWLDQVPDDHQDPVESSGSARIHWDLPERCTVVGSDAGDVLTGTVDDDKLCSLGEVDEILGQEGIDEILAGAGDDLIDGDEGADIIRGEDGDDYLYGSRGDDTLIGGPGYDVCYGSRGKDTFRGCEEQKDFRPKSKKRDAEEGDPGEGGLTYV